MLAPLFYFIFCGLQVKKYFLKSRRHFYSANLTFDKVNGSPDNSLSYLLQSSTVNVGLRYTGLKGLIPTIEIGVGFEKNLVLDQYNMKYQPNNYQHSDGAVLFASLTLPFQYLNLLYPIEKIHE